jgi:hypothetical protein
MLDTEQPPDVVMWSVASHCGLTHSGGNSYVTHSRNQEDTRRKRVDMKADEIEHRRTPEGHSRARGS